MTELVMLRHGESLWNAEDRYQGQQGTGLSPLGHQQAKQAAEYLLTTGSFDQIVASDLQRVSETLQPYLDGQDHPEVRIDRRWREIDVGTWGGRTFTEVYAEEPEVVEAFARGEDVARGGGETFAQLRERVWEAIREVAGAGPEPLGGAGIQHRAALASARVDSRPRPARRVLVVTHGGPIRVATASALRLPPGGEVTLDPPVNCSLTTLQVDDLLAVTTLTAYNTPTSTGAGSGDVS